MVLIQIIMIHEPIHRETDKMATAQDLPGAARIADGIIISETQCQCTTVWEIGVFEIAARRRRAYARYILNIFYIIENYRITIRASSYV